MFFNSPCRRQMRACLPGGVAVRGFTLIELIMVIVILGVLAAVAAPRMFSNDDLYARGFHDETVALLRYAQKSAIAQRRTVCVVFSAAAPAFATLTIAPVSASNVCSLSLLGSNKNTELNKNCAGGPSESGQPVEPRGCVLAKDGVSYQTAPASLRFDGLGQPQAFDASGTLLSAIPTIKVSQAANAITVEAGTGYVHE